MKRDLSRNARQMSQSSNWGQNGRVIPIVTPDEMAAIDAAAPAPVEELIARAGWAVARTARQMLGGTYGRRVVVIAGKGNNGADGWVAAQLLERRGVRVIVVDPAGYICQSPQDKLGSADGNLNRATLPACDLIIDAAFGTGLTRPYVAPHPANATTPVLAVDIPSGISGLTGQQFGQPLRATRTVTFAALKPGHLIGDGPETSGAIELADIGLDTTGATAHLVEASDVHAWLPERARNGHKWNAAVRLIAGSPGMTGAAQLAATAALRAGAGYVRRSVPGFDAHHAMPIESVTTSIRSEHWSDEVLADINRFAVLAIGPGLGSQTSTRSEVAKMLGAPVPIVIDGDGLAALGDEPARVLANRARGAPPVVLTPHEGEFKRLGGTLEPNGDRFAAVRDLAARFGAIVLLKGPTTIIARPDGHVLASNTGDARLATAGTGDVLTGIIAAFIARGTPAFQAAAAGAWVHGQVAQRLPTIGMIASDLPAAIPEVLAELGDNRDVPNEPGA